RHRSKRPDRRTKKRREGLERKKNAEEEKEIVRRSFRDQSIRQYAGKKQCRTAERKCMGDECVQRLPSRRSVVECASVGFLAGYQYQQTVAVRRSCCVIDRSESPAQKSRKEGGRLCFSPD